VNVFVVPSWYPGDEGGVDGIFHRDQALAIAELRPDWGVAVSVWAQSEGAVWLTRPSGWARAARAVLVRRGATKRRLRDNLLELRRPVFSWTHVIRGGNRARVLAANRRNLEDAVAALGSVDVVHAHVGYPAGWLAMQLHRETGIPYVVTEHMGPFPFPGLRGPDGGPIDLVREPLAGAAARIAVSPALAAELKAAGFEDVDVVPNLVDERLFTASPRPPEEPFTFFTLAALVGGKGIDDLVAAIRLLPSDAAVFRIGGDGPLRRRLRRRAAQLGVADRVAWLGALSREEVRSEYRRCHCFVLPSHHESFGLVVAEALACGRPVVATRSGGPESIVTAENGLLVPPGDVPALAQALAEMRRRARFYDPETLRASAVARFSRPVVVDALERVYARVAQGERRGRR
jgi:glycosyltransferase involved in cell wall biosynthesis